MATKAMISGMREAGCLGCPTLWRALGAMSPFYRLETKTGHIRLHIPLGLTALDSLFLTKISLILSERSASYVPPRLFLQHRLSTLLEGRRCWGHGFK